MMSVSTGHCEGPACIGGGPLGKLASTLKWGIAESTGGIYSRWLQLRAHGAGLKPRSQLHSRSSPVLEGTGRGPYWNRSRPWRGQSLPQTWQPTRGALKREELGKSAPTCTLASPPAFSSPAGASHCLKPVQTRRGQPPGTE